MGRTPAITPGALQGQSATRSASSATPIRAKRAAPLATMTLCSSKEAKCVVPESRGALSRDEEDALWQEFYTAAPVQRREFEPSSKRRKRRPASSLPATG